MSGYELRIYHVTEGRIDTVRTVFRELVAPMMGEYGMAAVGMWAGADGRVLVQVTEHSDLADIQGNWDRFHADPRWRAGLRARRGEQSIVEKVESTPLVGIDHLPPLPADAG